MGAMEDVLQEDLAAVSQADYIPWNQLQGQSVLVTGGTGLIGSTVIEALCYANTAKITFEDICLGPESGKAEQMLGHENEVLHFIQGSVEKLPEINEAVDYIIHGASPTASLFLWSILWKPSRLQFRERPIC